MIVWIVLSDLSNEIIGVFTSLEKARDFYIKEDINPLDVTIQDHEVK